MPVRARNLNEGRGRSFEERFQVNLESFEQIYEAFKCRSKSRLENFAGYTNEWNAVFEMDFPSAEEGLSARQRTAPSTLDEAIFDLIKNYTLHEGVGTAKIKRTVDSILPVDSLDPVFWRALIEVFTRTLLTSSGAPKKWVTEDFIELACDIITVKQQSAKKLSKVALANELLKGNKLFLRNYKKEGRTKPTPRSLTTRILQLYKNYGEPTATSWGKIPKKHPAQFQIIFSNWLEKHKKHSRSK
jgi:hypothetical protein